MILVNLLAPETFISLTFTEIGARVASQEVSIVFISEIENENLLRNVHVIVAALIRLIADRTTLSTPGFHRVASPLADGWLTWTQAVLHVALEDDTVAFSETEGFVN